MHLILQEHIKDLVNDFGIDSSFDMPKLFEFFCNYCVLSKKYLGRFNPIDITTKEDDASIDGIAVIIDGELITSIDDAEHIFSSHKRNLFVEFIFTQVKSGEAFRKEEISNFSLGLKDFLSLTPSLPNGEYNIEMLNVIKVVFRNLKKVLNSRPSCSIYYCTSGTYKGEAEIQACFDFIKSEVSDLDYFNDVSVFPIGRKEILSYWKDINEKNEAKIKLVEFCGIPKNKDIPQSYVAVVNAKEFVTELLLDSEGNLKHSVFEENIRSFLGSKNEVNAKISDTLNSPDKKHLFSVLNNGITIVAPQLTLTPNSKEMDLINYQIINGCQTSNTLVNNFEQLDDAVNVVIRFIESPNNDISTDIIAATNSQTGIPSESFHGLREKAKLVQHYFNAKNNDVDTPIYFERRENEYKINGYYSTQVFDVRELSRIYAACYLNQPHNASRYVKTIFISTGDLLFKSDDNESLYYAAALTYYKYNTLINGKKIDANNYKKFKWHIIQLYQWVVHNKVESIPCNSKKAEKYAEKVISSLVSKDKKYIGYFKRCHEIIDSIPTPSDDQIKRNRFTVELMEQAKKMIPK
ncbi:AIPR family protein [Vibrio cholerae]|uniref:AIPR family protein n=2 Tax=Vibrio cholerae TaxID=666 RepID=UPI000E0C6471|nr:AIPR family protein [Vibrio cholerae]